MTHRKLHLQEQLEAGAQQPEQQVIIKARALVVAKSHARNKIGKKINGTINGAKVNRSGIGRKKFFATPFGSLIRLAGLWQRKYAHSSCCQTCKCKIL